MMIDYLQRDKDLDNLITVIDNLSRLRTGSTFALNGQWGSGKTFLLELLVEKLKSINKDTCSDSRYFIVRYDCWKNNYYSEPIIPMLSAVIEELDYASREVKDGILNAVKDSAAKYIGAILKNTIGINPIEIKDDIENHIKDQHNANFAFDNVYALKTSLENVRESLKKLAEQKTIIFIIDELDRCLPEYSIHVLENIHHIFSGMDNFITLLAIDRDELSQMIKTAYGTDIDVSAYLKKIIDFYVQLDFGEPDSDYLDKYSSFMKHFTGNETSGRWCHATIPILMKDLDIRTQEKIWKKAELLHRMITKNQLDFSCLVYELIVLIKNYYHEHSALTNHIGIHKTEREFQNMLDTLLGKSSKSSMSSVLNGKRYPELNDHPSGRILWYQEGWELLQTHSLKPINDHIRIRHACTYADTIKEDDVLMQKFTQLSQIIE